MRELRFLLATAVLLSVTACRPRCTIVCDVDGIDDGVVTAFDLFNRGAAIDSTEMRDGKFEMKFRDKTPTMVDFRRGEEEVGMVFTEDGIITLSGNPSVNTLHIEGTPSNVALSDFSAEYYELCKIYCQIGDEVERLAVADQFRRLMRDTYEKNRNNIFGLHLLTQVGIEDMTTVDVIAAMDSLPDNLQALPLVEIIRGKCMKRMRVEPRSEGSDVVPHYVDIRQNDLNGVEVSLSSVVESGRYRYVLVDFWASWCNPCMAMVDGLKTIHDKYHARGFEIYGVSIDTSADRWRRAVEKNGMSWINVSKLSHDNNEAVDDYVVETIPQNFLIECSTGEIIGLNLTCEMLDARLSELLK